jgi:CDP-diacylglycerol--serine O-phosphatidyltransferase
MPTATSGIGAAESPSDRGPGRYLADVLTCGNALSGVGAIYFALIPYYLAAGGLLLLAMLFDALDGAAARKYGSWHGRGHLVDTAADLVTMAAAPAVLTWSAISRTAPEHSLLAALAASVYGGLATARLLDYAAGGYRQDRFRGLPSPGGTLMVMLAVFLLGPTPFLLQSPLALGLVVIILSPLMVAPVAYPKLRGRIIIPLAALGLTAGVPAIYVYVTTFSYDPLIVKIGAAVALAYFLGYAVSGPLAEFAARIKNGRTPAYGSCHK